MRELDVVGVRVEMPSNQPIVLLHEQGGDRYLPIWIGAVEATAIALAREGEQPPRPLTHDLMAQILIDTGNPLREVHITEVVDGVFHAMLVLGSGVEVSARPSDAIALALRCEAPVRCAESVLDEAGIHAAEQPEVVAGTEAPAEPADPAQQEEAVEQFREFLDHVTPEDFE